jgi:hypothetical protein
VEEARQTLRDVYAEVQMVASDDVLEIGGALFHLLSKIYFELNPESSHDPVPEEHLTETKEHLERASEMLYEARQSMRKDLGITALPIARPPGYGVL